MDLIFSTDEVSNDDKSSDLSSVQEANISSISITFEVLKLDNVMFSNLSHPENKKLIFFTDEVSKLETLSSFTN